MSIPGMNRKSRVITPPDDKRGPDSASEVSKRARLAEAGVTNVVPVALKDAATDSNSIPFHLEFFDSLIESERWDEAQVKIAEEHAKLAREAAEEARRKQEYDREWNCIYVYSQNRLKNQQLAKFQEQERAKAEAQKRKELLLHQQAQSRVVALRVGYRFEVTKAADDPVPLGTSESIFNAARNNQLAVLLKLCREWAGTKVINEHKNQDGWTALLMAAAFGHDDCLRVLIAANADVNTIARYGITALHCAAIEGNIVSCGLLIDEGASLWKKNVCGHRPSVSAMANMKGHQCVAVIEAAEKAARAAKAAEAARVCGRKREAALCATSTASKEKHEQQRRKYFNSH